MPRGMLIFILSIGFLPLFNAHIFQRFFQRHSAVLQDDAGTPTVFQAPGLASKTNCGALTASDCKFFAEASQACPTFCQQLLQTDAQGASQPQGQQPPADAGPPPQEAAPVFTVGAGGGGGGGGGGAACFHGDVMVQTERGPRKLSQISGKKGIKVLSRDNGGEPIYSPINYWIHADETTWQEYIEFQTDDGHTLTITADHLIYMTTDCHHQNINNTRTVFARRVQPGHCLFVQRNGSFVETKVIGKQRTTKRGIYAPITDEGNVVVNGIVASCFVCLENEPLQKIMYLYLNWIRTAASNWLPDNLIALFYSRPFESKVVIPESIFSFWDLSKTFVR